MADLETWAGLPVKLGLTASDGRTDLYPRATIFNGNGSSVPVAAINLDHKSIGFYRADIVLASGTYFAVYRNYLDAGRSQLDHDREHDQDSILVHPFDVPRLGVAYDSSADRLLIEATLSRNGAPVPASELISVIIEVFDGDDNLLTTLTDVSPDTEGVFRASVPDPGLLPDKLYFTKVAINTGAGVVVGQAGFQTTE